MEPEIRERLDETGRTRGTPCFVYFPDEVAARLERLAAAFDGRFSVSYAVKANPNLGLLRRLRGALRLLDVSSAGELRRGLDAGFDPLQISFSGPGKRPFELAEAVERRCGEIVCESPRELEMLDELAAGTRERVGFLIRINPLRMPRRFGVNMAGRPSQFGIDEEDVDSVLESLSRFRRLDFRGFHIYSGTNSLDEDAICENFGIFRDLFVRFSEVHRLQPRKLVFGSGFGIPYVPGEGPLDVERIAGRLNPVIDDLKAHPGIGAAECCLEMGRWLVGPAGYLVTSVIGAKRSRGVEIRICDAGFNNHLSACGMMGTVIRRNWRFWKLNGHLEGPLQKCLLVGPLCTTIDQLASEIELPDLDIGDRLAIGCSGAYGLTASPTRFISHPEPREFLVVGAGPGREILDVTESSLNCPPGDVHLPPVGRSGRGA